MTEKPVISSALLGLHAYQRAQGRPTGKLSDAKTYRVRKPEPLVPSAPEVSVKEKKISVLKSLQAQSNSGFVKMRDVSTALDTLLKSS